MFWVLPGSGHTEVACGSGGLPSAYVGHLKLAILFMKWKYTFLPGGLGFPDHHAQGTAEIEDVRP